MIGVPSYQVIQFLDWLRNRQVRLSTENFDRSRVQQLALEYLRSDAAQIKLDLGYLMKVFQSCPMIEEEDVIEQMEHFARCGECIHYIRERSEGRIFWAPLHPLLLNFIRHSNRTGFQQFIGEELHSTHIRTRGSREENEIFRYAIRLVGRRLFEEFQRFIMESPPEIVRDYEIEKRRSRHGVPKRGRGNIRLEKGAIPITPMDNPEEAAERLTRSVRDLLRGELYDKEVYESYLALFSPFSENLSQSLQFLDWLSTKYPELNIVGDIPSEQIDVMVQSFCEEKGFSNVASFSKSVKKWIKGDAPENVLNKIANLLLAERREGTMYRSNASPFNRYNSVRMHGMFLFLSTGDFPAFIDRHWRDLNALTGDSLDIYFSRDDLKKRVSGYETLAEFKSLSIPVVQLPGLILWEHSLKDARAIPLGRLEHEEIVEVMKHVVYRINEGDSVEEVVMSATDFVSSLLKERISDSTGLIETKIIINGGENIMNNNTSYEVNQSQVGAMGPNANASDIVFSQIWDAHSKELNLPALATELSKLRAALRKEPQTDENDIAIGAIAKAEGSAKEGSGPKTLGDLKSAGKVALSCAEKIGMDVAAAAIKAALGL